MSRLQWMAEHLAKERSATKAERELHEPLRVLLAEDQPEMRSLLRSALVRDGYEVIEA